MTLFQQPKLAISLPAIELARITVPSSVFAIDELDICRLSPDLQAELDRVVTTFALSPSDVFVVSRSEMFTHGETLAWLRARIPDVQDHLCFSDGSSLKTIPGFVNHIYFFRPSSTACRRQMARTLYRAPELFASCSSQINSAYPLLAVGSGHPPEAVLLQGRSSLPREPVLSYPFYLDPSRIDHTLAAAKTGHLQAAGTTRWTRTTVVCLTEASLAQLAFVRYVARLILSVFFTPHRRLLLLAPTLDFGGDSAGARLSAIYLTLAPHLGDLPRARASNIEVVMGSLDDLHQQGHGGNVQDLLLPASSAFWRHDSEAYANLSRVVVFPDSLPFDSVGGHDLYSAALGRSPSVADIDEDAPMVIPELDS